MPDPNNILDQKTKTAWLCVPKVANTAIKSALLRWHKLPVPQDIATLHSHPSFQFASAKAISKHRHYYRVAFVRNPYSRLASCWRDKCINRPGWWESIPMFGLRTGMAFNDFLDVVCDQYDHEMNIHYRPQSNLIFHHQKPAYDKLCKLESLDKDWKDVQRQVTGLCLPLLPNLKKSNSTDSKSWISLYEDKTYTKVRERYAEDVIRFGYESSYNVELYRANT